MASLSSSSSSFHSHIATSNSHITKTAAAFSSRSTMPCQSPRRSSFPRPISAVFTTTPETEKKSGRFTLAALPSTASLYQVLGIQAGASCQEIKKAYRTLARELHPDVTGGRKDSDFIRVHEAYSILSDPERRADYDRAMFIKRSLMNQRSSPFTAAAAVSVGSSRGAAPMTTSGFPIRMSRTWETDQCW